MSCHLDPSMIEVADRVGNQTILALRVGCFALAGNLMLLNAQLHDGLVLEPESARTLLEWLDRRSKEWQEQFAEEFRH